MADQREAPPPGVETIPDDVNEELSRVEEQAQKKLIQKIMDDHDFGQRLIDNPEAALSESGLESELGVGDEVEGHARWRTKWRWKCYYTYYRAWAHYKRGYWWF